MENRFASSTASSSVFMRQYRFTALTSAAIRLHDSGEHSKKSAMLLLTTLRENTQQASPDAI
jgi:hypothetical protein